MAYASYSYVDATFQSTNVIRAENNPQVATSCNSLGIPGADSDANCLVIRPGDRMTGIPRHRFKAGFDYKLTPKWLFGADLISASDQFFYGDEANLDKPLPGYTKVNLHSSYDVTDHVQVYGLIENLFDEQYGIYGTYFNRGLAQTAGPGAGGAGGPEPIAASMARAVNDFQFIRILHSIPRRDLAVPLSCFRKHCPDLLSRENFPINPGHKGSFAANLNLDKRAHQTRGRDKLAGLGATPKSPGTPTSCSTLRQDRRSSRPGYKDRPSCPRCIEPRSRSSSSWRETTSGPKIPDSWLVRLGWEGR
jgi:hypothetical protein